MVVRIEIDVIDEEDLETVFGLFDLILDRLGEKPLETVSIREVSE